MEAEFPAEFPIAWRATQDVLAAVEGIDLSSLARHSPALRGFDWDNYLRVSVVRLVRAQAALTRAGARSGALLDVGSYFGNFSLMFAANGYAVQGTDTYKEYGRALAPIVRLLRSRGVKVLDAARVGRGLERLPAKRFDVVALLGVVEHIPHTPRPLLEAVDRVLKPGGHLLIDTPNLAYVYNREKLASGEPLLTPIEQQYFTEIPFEGHHREYTASEIQWMLHNLGHKVLHREIFNYSIYGLRSLEGRDLDYYGRMLADETLREVLLFVSQKPASDGTPRAAMARRPR